MKVCARCGIIVARLDKAGCCPACAYEQATGHAYIDWHMPSQEPGSAAQVQAATAAGWLARPPVSCGTALLERAQ